MTDAPSPFADVLNCLRTTAWGCDLNAMFREPPDRMQAVKRYVDEYLELLRMIVCPDPVNLSHLVEV